MHRTLLAWGLYLDFRFVPPGFRNITYKIFIIFGILCFGSATQTFFTYPETAGKTIEEIEVLFSKDGPHPWKTRPGDSRLDAEIAQVVEAKRGMSTAEYAEHVKAEMRGSVDHRV